MQEIGMNVGWGFQFQQPIFIIALILILTLFAANLFGFFEIAVPQISEKLHKKSAEHSFAGNFLAGVLATILATPCTAPFLGTAVGFALGHGQFEIFVIFTIMGFGMAAPYLLFSIFPQLITKLPKPGAWMLTVKKLMGVLLLIAAIWLLWVLSNQIGHLAAYVLLAIIALKLLKLWAMPRIKFLSNKKARYSVFALIIILAFAIPLRLANNNHTVTNSDNWQPFNEARIAQLVESGNIVLVDITADWCLTCKVNKIVVLDDKDIKAELTKYGMVAMRGDWTNKDETIADYMKKYNRVGIPFNIVYGPAAPDGIVLSELLNKRKLLEAIDKAR
jgi:suppressor for copper-sensitivity B